MKKYVGIANTVPDSEVPRKLIQTIIQTRMIVSGTIYGTAEGKAEVIACTPAEIETATVKV
ncbi:hypothetical protein D3C84_1296990 [compost metagenome]